MSENQSVMRLYSKQSKRLYLNRQERLLLEEYVSTQEPLVRFLILVLLRTGCRLSEALNIVPEDIDAHDGLIAIRSLKKRDTSHVRELPVPHELASELLALKHHGKGNRLFPQSRSTAWRQVGHAMKHSGIVGIHATAKGLRHSFGVHCAFNNIPLPLAQKWMGHADIQTTAIYFQIVGKEEREMAERLW